MTGSVATRSRNLSRGRTTVSVATRAAAVADRGAPSSSASSPKTSPSWSVVEDGLLAGLGRHGDLHLAADDDEQRVARVAGMEDHLAPAEPSRAGPGGDPLEGGRIEPREERDPGERRDQWATGEHVRASYAPTDARPARCARCTRCPSDDIDGVASRLHGGPPSPTISRAMTVDMPRRLRLTVLGCSTAVPHPASPASGYLVTWDTTVDPARRRPGRRQSPRPRDRPTWPRRRDRRPHARRPLHRPGRACATCSRGAPRPTPDCRSISRPAAAIDWRPSPKRSPNGPGSSMRHSTWPNTTPTCR